MYSFFILFLSCTPSKTIEKECKEYYGIASKYQRAGVTDSAKIYFKKSIACSTSFADAYVSLAHIQLGEQLYEDAIVSYEKAIAIDSTNITLYFCLGLAYEERKDFFKAESVYEIAHNLNPKNQPISYVLSKIYLENTKYEKALILLEQLAAEFLKDKKVILSLADAHYDCKNYLQALEKDKIIQEDLAEFPDIYIKIAECYEGLHEYSNAAKYLLMAIKKSDNKLTLYYNLIAIFLKTEQYKSAKRYISQAFTIAPVDPYLTTLRGDLYIGLGDKAREKEDFMSAITYYKTAKKWFIKGDFDFEGFAIADKKIKDIYQTTGRIVGKAICKLSKEALPYVGIVVLGMQKGTVSNINGEYYIIILPGIYDVQARIMGYENKTIRNIEVKKGQVINADFELIVEKY